MSLDLDLVGAIIRDSNLKPVLEAGVAQDMLYDKGQNVFIWLCDEHSKHGAVPSGSAVERQFGFAVDEPKDPLDHYIEEIKSRALGNLLGKGIQKAIADLKGKEPGKALKVLREAVTRSSRHFGTKNGPVDLRTTTKDRQAEYDRIKGFQGGVDGIKSPWPELDAETQGFRDSETTIVVSRTNVGKTFLMTILTDEIWRQDKTALLIPMEMGQLRVARRLDSVVARVPWNEFRLAMLGATDETKLKDMYDKMAKSKTPLWMADKSVAQNVQDIEILVQNLKPDIVLIDGLYLVNAKNQRQGRTERIEEVIGDIVTLSTVNKVPIIATVQFSKKVTASSRKGNMEHISYAYRIAQDADNILALFRDQQLKERNEMLMTLVKARDTDLCSFKINWDLAKMDFSMIEKLTLAQAAEKEEEDVDF